MRGKHEPRGEFVDRLEADIAREARRRLAHAEAAPRWIPSSPRWALAGVAALVVVSMTIGGGVVAAAYRVQSNAQRDLLVSSYTQRAQLAQDRLNLVKEQLALAERRVSIGLAAEDTVAEARLKVADAQAQVQSIQLQVQEVQITSQEPRDQISSPLVSGRDFVSDRLRVAILVPQAALDLEKVRLKATERRVAVGLADAADLDAIRARVTEAQVALTGFQRRLQIRQQFLSGQLDATMADLQLLLSEAELGHMALLPKFDLARTDEKRTQALFEKGLAQQVDVKAAALRLMELKLDLVRLEVEIANLQQRLARKGK